MDVKAIIQDAAAAATPAAPAPRRPEAGGRNLPPAGKAAPPAANVSPAVAMERAIEQIRSYLRDSQRQLDFQYDESSGRTIIKVINPASGEVIRQIPTEAILKLAATIDTQGFRTFDDLA